MPHTTFSTKKNRARCFHIFGSGEVNFSTESVHNTTFIMMEQPEYVNQELDSDGGTHIS